VTAGARVSKTKQKLWILSARDLKARRWSGVAEDQCSSSSMMGLRRRVVAVIFGLKIPMRSVVVVFVKSMTINFGAIGVYVCSPIRSVREGQVRCSFSV
jgi:hypothetical protein